MLFLLEGLIADIVAVLPQVFLLLGAPELPRQRRKRFLTVRSGGQTALVEL